MSRSPRRITIAIDVPTEKTDQQVADQMRSLLIYAAQGFTPGPPYADTRGLEVHAITLTPEGSDALRRELFK